jgi:hypothetical protein
MDVQLGLVGDGERRLAGGDQLGRVVGVGRLDQLDLEPGLGEKALLQGDDQRPVVRVDEPVEHHRKLLRPGLGLDLSRGREG